MITRSGHLRLVLAHPEHKLWQRTYSEGEGHYHTRQNQRWGTLQDARVSLERPKQPLGHSETICDDQVIVAVGCLRFAVK